MDEREQRDGINELMQPSPAQAAETPHHAVGRGRGKRCQTEPSRAANDEIPAVGDLMKCLFETVALVGKKQREMRSDITEGPDTKYAAHIDQVSDAQNTPQRRHRQRDTEKYQRPESGAVDQIVERPRTMRDGPRVEQDLG